MTKWLSVIKAGGLVYFPEKEFGVWISLQTNPLFLQMHKRIQSGPITIAIHVLFWLGFFLFPFIDDNRQHISNYFIIRNAFLLLLLASFYYINSLSLIPKLLLPGKLRIYTLIILLIIITISVVNMVFAQVLDELMDHEMHHPSFLRRLLFPVFPSLFVFALSTAIKITNEWFRNEKQKKEMENEKLNSELAFLKSQVNPHFLFNILNNICSLARKKSDETENAIIKLSQIMRYMLYESKDEKVSLEKEIEYLKNYIELQRLRISEKVVILFNITGNTENNLIEPMLLIPFVENAFKHGISYVDDSRIEICLTVKGKTIHFTVDNLIVKKREDDVSIESGIGLKNVIRRLVLLYPGKHEISIQEDNNKYLVDLNISL
jgi:two-component system, LytTR family, sensor kinase